MLREPGLVAAIEALSYQKVRGNRWERSIDDTRVAAVDLLIPTYRTRARDTVRVGEIVTTEVPGLADALRRPCVETEFDVLRTDGVLVTARVLIPDAASTLALKALARTVRNEARDAEDLWRCLEIANADGVTPAIFEDDVSLRECLPVLRRELNAGGTALAMITAGLGEEEGARRRTRIRALLAAVAGITS